MLLLLCGILATAAEAQRGEGRGGRGRGFGGGFGGPSVLDNESVVEAIGLSEDQVEKARTAVAENQPDRMAMMPIFMRMRDEEQRPEAQAELAELMSAAADKQDEALGKVMSDSQLEKYKRAKRQAAGIRGLMDPRITAELKLTDDQRSSLMQKAQNMFGRMRELRDMDEDERAAATAEIEQEIASVLTREQVEQWNTALGEPIGDLGDARIGDVAAATPQSRGGREAGMSDEGAGGEDAEEAVAEADPLDRMLDALDEEGPAAAAPSGPVTADFGRSPADGAAATVRFNFRNAPWEDVLTLFAETAGLTLDLSEVPPGTFSYYDRNEYTPDEALDILNGYLLPRGYLVLRRNSFLVSKAVGDGVSPNLVRTSLPEELDRLGDNAFARVVFETGTVPASELVDDVNALLGPQGEAVAMGASNRLVVSDVTRNLREVRSLLANIVRPVAPDALGFQAFPLRHITAEEAEPLVRKLVGADVQLGNGAGSPKPMSSDPRQRFMEMMSGRSRSREPEKKEPDPKQARVVVDERTNSLLVTATPGDLEIVRQAVEQIDVPRTDGAGPESAAGGPILRVYPIAEGDMTRISETLEAMVPGISINRDERAKQLHVLATAARHNEVNELVGVITGRGTGGSQVAVVPLSRMNAVDAAYLVQDLFSGEDQPPTVQPSPDGRGLVVRGRTSDVTQVKSLLTQLGEGEAAPARATGPVREFSLGGRDPEQALRLLQQLWDAGHERPLRVIGGPRPSAVDDARRNAPEDDRSAAVTGPADTRFVAFQADDPAEADPAPPHDDRGDSADESPVAAVAVSDDRLTISSADPQTLDELESLLAYVLNRTAPQKQWQVYYLRAATAEEAADMLGTFFPQADVGMGVLTTPSSASTTQLRIVAEPRTNALFVTGPADQVADVEQMLEFIDATDLPESYRDRVPRTIEVRYADVTEVAGVVREVFADLLPQPARGRGRGEESQAATGFEPGARLTIGVDTGTSQLIVAADEALFGQVEQLVQTLDQAAADARRTVRVVNLRNTDPAAVKAMLGTLLPKVSFTTSSSATRSTGSSSRSQPESNSGSTGSPFGGGGGGDDERRERIRRFFEERARQQSSGGDSGGRGGRPGGDRGGFGGRGGRGRG